MFTLNKAMRIHLICLFLSVIFCFPTGPLASDEIEIKEYEPKSDSDCANWSYRYKEARKKGTESEFCPKSFQCMLNDLLSSNLKYVGKFTHTNSAIDTREIKTTDEGEIILNDQNEITFESELTDESTNLYSLGLQYEASLKDILGSFDPAIQFSPNYYILNDRISIAALTFSSNFEYSNTGTANNLDQITIDVKTEKGFKYNVGLTYTGCLGDLFKFKLGCYNYDGYFADAKTRYDRDIKATLEKEKQRIEKERAEAEIKELNERIKALESRLLTLEPKK